MLRHLAVEVFWNCQSSFNLVHRRQSAACRADERGLRAARRRTRSPTSSRTVEGGGARSTCLMGNERLCLANVLTMRLGRKETIANASPREVWSFRRIFNILLLCTVDVHKATDRICAPRQGR